MGKLASSIARDIASPAVKMGNRSLFSVAPCRVLSLVLSFAPKESTIPPRGGSPTVRAGVGASSPHRGKGACANGRTRELSSGQTIGAVRTAVRSACCLPELRVANRLRRLYPLDTRFPSFPFGNLRAPKLARNPGNCNHCSCKKFSLLEANKMTFLGANHQRSPHCRAHSLLFA